MTQNLWDAAKAVLRGNFIAIQSYLKKQETSQINNLNLHLKQLEKEEQKNPKVGAAIVRGPRTAMKSGPCTAMKSGPHLP